MDGKRSIRIILWLYERLLWLYPAVFRARFADEQRQVFAQALEESVKPPEKLLLLELAHLPGVLLRCHWVALWQGGWGTKLFSQLGRLLDEKNMEGCTMNKRSTPWGWALVGIVPFLWSLLFSLYDWTLRAGWVAFNGGLPTYRDPTYWGWVSAGLFLLMVVYGAIIVAGWVRGFPAWSYPAIIHLFVALSFVANVAMPGVTLFGYPFGQRAVGSAAFLPLLPVVLIGLLLTRSDPGRPFREGLQGLEQNLSRLSFGLYACTPVLLWLMFDEVHSTDPFFDLIHIPLVIGALLYLRSQRPLIQSMSLLVAMIVFWLASAVYLGLYWDEMHEFMETLRGSAIMILLTFTPWLLWWNQKRKASVVS